MAQIWERRCRGATIPQLSKEFGVSVATIHDDIETVWTQLRSESIDLAKQQREHSLSFWTRLFRTSCPTSWLTGLLDDLWGTPISLHLPSIEHHISALL